MFSVGHKKELESKQVSIVSELGNKLNLAESNLLIRKVADDSCFAWPWICKVAVNSRFAP